MQDLDSWPGVNQGPCTGSKEPLNQNEVALLLNFKTKCKLGVHQAFLSEVQRGIVQKSRDKKENLTPRDLEC